MSDAANALIVQRKQIEDNVTKLLGKDMEGSLLPKVGTAIKRLTKGDIQKWTELMNRIPKDMRKEVVISSMNDVFKGGNVDRQALNSTQFSKFMDDLDRSPKTKRLLYKELPKESIRAIENLRTVPKGISTALQDKITTGRITSFFDDNNGMLRRMMGKALVFGATVKGGPLSGAAVSEFLSQTTDGAKSAAMVLGSNQFQSMIRNSVKHGVADGAVLTEKLKRSEAAFEKSKIYKRWENSLVDSERAKLISVGTITYLLSEEE